MYAARFEFLPGVAEDFLPKGQLVTEMAFTEISEIVGCAQEFAELLAGSLVYSQETGRIVDLSDFIVK